jgi:hypothetical protein
VVFEAADRGSLSLCCVDLVHDYAVRGHEQGLRRVIVSQAKFHKVVIGRKCTSIGETPLIFIMITLRGLRDQEWDPWAKRVG